MDVKMILLQRSGSRVSPGNWQGMRKEKNARNRRGHKSIQNGHICPGRAVANESVVSRGGTELVGSGEGGETSDPGRGSGKRERHLHKHSS